MHKLAKLSAAERQQLIDDFVDETFAGTSPDAPGAHIADGMRKLPSALPDDPTPEQVDAWVELAELVGDEDFRAACRRMAVQGGSDQPQQPPFDHETAVTASNRALADGVDPASTAGREILAGFIDPQLPTDKRVELADQLDTFTDRRASRYWALLGVLNGWPPRPDATPALEWIIAALRG